MILNTSLVRFVSSSGIPALRVHHSLHSIMPDDVECLFEVREVNRDPLIALDAFSSVCLIVISCASFSSSLQMIQNTQNND